MRYIEATPMVTPAFNPEMNRPTNRTIALFKGTHRAATSEPTNPRMQFRVRLSFLKAKNNNFSHIYVLYNTRCKFDAYLPNLSAKKPQLNAPIAAPIIRHTLVIA